MCGASERGLSSQTGGARPAAALLESQVLRRSRLEDFEAKADLGYKVEILSQ